MLQKAIVFLILMLLALGVADARTPAVGEQVLITVSSGSANYAWYEGEITDIGDGLICLSVTRSSGSKPTPYDVCIGVGSITELTWR
jgi:hypothetical protein